MQRETAPVSESIPEGTSTATTRAPRVRASFIAVIAAASASAGGRESPLPKTASITRSAEGACATRGPSHACAAASASPRSFSRAVATTVTASPPNSSRSRRAATNPSPPLFPGPQ